MTKEPNWLAHAARRADAEPWTLGHLLSRCCELESVTHDDLAAELGCDSETLRWLCLCRVPSPVHYAKDVEQIAERFNVDVHRLAGLVRRADALMVLGGPAHERGLLLAARDREDGDDAQ